MFDKNVGWCVSGTECGENEQIGILILFKTALQIERSFKSDPIRIQNGMQIMLLDYVFCC